MMAAILNSTKLESDNAMLDSDTFLSSLRFTQKHSPYTLTQTNSIWLTWWWLPSLILPSWIQPFCTKFWVKIIQSDSKLIHSDSTGWWQPSWILPSRIWPSWIWPTLVFPLKQTHSTLAKIGSHHLPQKRLHSHFPPHHLHKKNFTHSFWLNLMMAAILNSTMLD